MKQVLSKKAVLAKGALLALLVPKLAADAMPDLNAILAGVNRKNWLDKKPGVIAAVKAKLANDADLKDVVSLLDKLDGQEGGMSPEEDEVAVDSPLEGVLSMLRGKLSDEDFKAVSEQLATLGKPAAADAGPAKDNQDPPFKDPLTFGKSAANGAAADAADPDKDDKKDDKPIAKAAMDAAIKTAVEGVQKTAKVAQDAAIKDAVALAKKETTEALRAVAEAEDFVKPYVGKLAVASDSAEAVYKAALDVLEVNTKDVHPSAYRHILEAQPRPGRETHLAFDHRGPAEGMKERFPNATRLGTG